MYKENLTFDVCLHFWYTSDELFKKYVAAEKKNEEIILLPSKNVCRFGDLRKYVQSL